MDLVRILNEADSAEEWMSVSDTAHMTEKEVKWKKWITSMLLNKSGKWGPFQHALYAKRFQDFILKIVPLSVQKKGEPFTAAVDWEHGVIYVSEGFLVDEAKLYQLNVIIRHELAHVLLQHEIRMAAEIGKLPYSRVSTSMSVHDLINIIADFEISNRKYTEEDKKIIEDLYINGQVIKGLVTEKHREKWAKLKLEDMYHELNKELEAMGADMERFPDFNSSSFRWSTTGDKLRARDTISTAGFNALQYYKDTVKPSIMWQPTNEYIAKSKVFNTKVAKRWQDLAKAVYEAVKDLPSEELEKLLNKISSSKMIEEIPIKDDLTVLIPEEKYWAVQVLKSLLGNATERPVVTLKKIEHSQKYRDAYNKIIKWCGRKADCPTEQITEIAKYAAEKLGPSLGTGDASYRDE